MFLKPAFDFICMGSGDFLPGKHMFHQKINIFLIGCYPDFLASVFISGFRVISGKEKNVKKSIKVLSIPRTYRFFSKQLPQNLFPEIVSSGKVSDMTAPAPAHFHGFFQIIYAPERRSHGTENKIKGFAVSLFINVKSLEITGAKAGIGQLLLIEIFHAVSHHFF